MTGARHECLTLFRGKTNPQVRAWPTCRDFPTETTYYRSGPRTFHGVCLSFHEPISVGISGLETAACCGS